jgi:hypothetical protein
MLPWHQYILIAILALLITACSMSDSTAAMSVPTAMPPTPPPSTPTAFLASVAPSRATSAEPFDCPVTQPPEPAFIPPAPWPAQPPGTDEFWFGTNGLWTALPRNGSWRQLALGEKFWWWSAEFDVAEDTTPDLTVRARRLDGDAPAFQVSQATNGYHESFNWAMLIGVELASPGCWEFTGHYKGHQLSFVLWVPSE